MAVELLRGLTGEAIDEVGNWAELLDARRESLAAAAPAIPEAAELVAALRRLAAERDG